MTNYKTFLSNVRRLSDNTIKSSIHDISLFARTQDPQTATRQDIERWIDSQKNLSPATLKRRVISIRQYYDWLIDNNLYKDPNPADSPYLIPKQAAVNERTLIDRVSLLEQVKNDTDALAIGLMAWCGLRVAEAVSAHTDHIQDGWLSVVGKGNKRRDIPLALLPDRAVKILAQRVAHAPTYLLVGERGPLTANGLWRRLQPIETHDLRRAALTAQVMGGANLESVRRLAGHATLGILHQYMVEDKNKMLEGLV